MTNQLLEFPVKMKGLSNTDGYPLGEGKEKNFYLHVNFSQIFLISTIKIELIIVTIAKFNYEK